MEATAYLITLLIDNMLSQEYENNIEISILCRESSAKFSVDKR
jgi:hypothetical protein